MCVCVVASLASHRISFEAVTSTVAPLGPLGMGQVVVPGAVSPFVIGL